MMKKQRIRKLTMKTAIPILIILPLMMVILIALTMPALATYGSGTAGHVHAMDSNMESIRTRRQEWLHWMAEEARANGEQEDGAIIQALQAEWAKEQEAFSILAKVIDNEAGECPWNHRVAVGAVVLNRVRCPYFRGDTVKEIVATPGQYLVSYTYNFAGIREGSWLAAKAAMDGEHNVPPDVVWQAEFIQGTSVWWQSDIDTGWYASTTYFCRGIPGVTEPWW